MLETPNPSIKLSASKMIKALIINKNNPKVKIVIGKVKITKSGLTKMFNTANTTATINGVVMESSRETPGKSLAIIITATAVRTSFNIVFIWNDLSLKLRIIMLINKLHYTIKKSYWIFGM